MPASGGRAPAYAGGYNPYSPFSWSPERLNTILRYRAGLERSLHRTLKALAERRAARAEAARTNEPGAPVPKARPGPALPCTNESEAPAPRTNQPKTTAPLTPTLSAPHERGPSAHKTAWIAAITRSTSALGLAATWRNQGSPSIVVPEAAPPGSRA